MNKPSLGLPGQIFNFWEGQPNNAFRTKIHEWPSGRRRNFVQAESILSEAIGWWDVSNYRENDRFLINLGTAGEVLDFQIGSSSTEATTNDPLLMIPENTGYLYNPGTTDSVTIPDSPLLSITNDIDIMLRIKPTTWMGLDRVLIRKGSSAGQLSYALILQSSGAFRLRLSTDGTNAINIDPPFPPSLNDGSVYWIRATYQADDGSGNRVAKFYWADDSGSIPNSWNQIGGTITTSGTYTIFDSPAQLSLISPSTEATPLIGNYYRVVIRNGFDGAGLTAVDIDFTNLPGNTSSVSIPSDVGFVESGYYTLKGRTGQYLSTPDNANLEVAGDIDIRAKVALDDWTPSTMNTLVAKYGAAGLRSYMFNVDTSGNLVFTWSADGTNILTATSTVPTGVSNGSIKWARVTLDVNNGSSGNDVAFYLSDDGVSWTQLGTTITTAGITSIHDNASPLEIGSNNSGTLNPFSGKIYKIIILNGINGTVVVSLNAEVWPVGTTSPIGIGDRGIRDGGLFLTGTSGQAFNVTAPVPKNLLVTEDVDVRVKILPNSWTAVTGSGSDEVYIRAQRVLNANVLLYVGRLASNRLAFAWYDSSLNQIISVSSDVLPSISPGSVKWIRYTLDVNNGSGGRDIRFYLSDDGTTWTQHGATVTQAGTTSVLTQDGINLSLGANIEIGSRSGYANDWFRGKMMRAMILNGIDGPAIFDANFETKQDGTTSFNDEALGSTTISIAGAQQRSFTFTSNGTNQTVSINRTVPSLDRRITIVPSVRSGGKPFFLLGTDDYLTVTNPAQHQALFFHKNISFTVLIVERNWSRPSVGEAIYIGKCTTLQNNFSSGWQIVRTSIGTTFIQNQLQPAAGTDARADPRNSNPADVRANATETPGVLYVITGTFDRVGVDRFSTAALSIRLNTTVAQRAALVNSINDSGGVSPNHPLRIGSHSIAVTHTPGFYGSFEFYAAAIFNRALSDYEVEVINRYYGTI